MNLKDYKISTFKNREIGIANFCFLHHQFSILTLNFYKWEEEKWWWKGV